MITQLAIILFTVHLIGAILFAAFGFYRSILDRKHEYWAGVLVSSFVIWEFLFFINIVIPHIYNESKIENIR